MKLLSPMTSYANAKILHYFQDLLGRATENRRKREASTWSELRYRSGNPARHTRTGFPWRREGRPISALI